MRFAHRLIVLYICANVPSHFKMPSRVIERMLTLNYDRDLEQTFVKHTHCTSTYHTWHLCRDIFLNPTSGSKDIQNYHLDIEACSNICTAHQLIILDICAELFENPSCGFEHKLSPLPWSDLCQNMRSAYRLMVLQISAKSFQNTVIEYLTLNYCLDLEPTLVHQGFKRYRVDTNTWRTDRKSDGRTDGRTDRRTDNQTDNEAIKTVCLPILWGDLI